MGRNYSDDNIHLINITPKYRAASGEGLQPNYINSGMSYSSCGRSPSGCY